MASRCQSARIPERTDSRSRMQKSFCEIQNFVRIPTPYVWPEVWLVK
jgi:hypothetical protein